jgi:hypothetical protein
MAKKQTRRSISVSRTTYERLKAFCETNNISMSQLVETRVNDFLGPNDGLSDGLNVGPSVGPSVGPGAVPMTTVASVMPASLPRPMPPRPVLPPLAPARPVEARPVPAPAPVPASAHGAPAVVQSPMTSAAVRFAVDPPPPIIKPRQDTAAPKPAEKRPEQIFTF